MLYALVVADEQSGRFRGHHGGIAIYSGEGLNRVQIFPEGIHHYFRFGIQITRQHQCGRESVTAFQLRKHVFREMVEISLQVGLRRTTRPHPRNHCKCPPDEEAVSEVCPTTTVQGRTVHFLIRPLTTYGSRRAKSSATDLWAQRKIIRAVSTGSTRAPA